MAVVVEKGIPLPARSGRAPNYPWRGMEVGDSFAIPLSGERHRSGNDIARVRVTSALAYAKKLTGHRYAVRTLRDEGVVRAWRVS